MTLFKGTRDYLFREFILPVDCVSLYQKQDCHFFSESDEEDEEESEEESSEESEESEEEEEVKPG